MIKRALLLCVLVSSALFTQAEKELSVDDIIKKAEGFFFNEDYYTAQIYYHQIEASYIPKLPRVQYCLGVCYINTGTNYEKAIEYIEASEEFVYDEGVEEDFHYYLGKAHHLNYSFIEAVNNYHKFIDLVSVREERVEEVNRLIRQCKNAELIMKNPVNVQIVNMGETINSKYSDYTPYISADESVLLFTSRRSSSTGGMLDENGRPDSISGQYFEDIYASIKLGGEWKKPVGVGAAINTEGHDAVAGISPDGEEMYVYRSDSSLYGNLFKSVQGDYEWGQLKKLPSPINSRFWEGSISASSDGQTIYFASNRPDGYGGKDLYMINKLPDGSWAVPKNLGPSVNTPYDEDAPFFHEESSTLYFSSQGHYNMGGFDIFKSILKSDGEWQPAENIGYPINTTGDDISFVLSGNGKRGYYSARRDDGFGEQDIYVLNFEDVIFDDADKGPVTILKGVVETCDNKEDVGALVKLFEYETAELLGVYKPNPTTGNFVIVIPQGKRYQMQVEAPGYAIMNRIISKAYNEGQSEVNEKIILCTEQNDEIDKKTIIVAKNDSIELLDSAAIMIDILANDVYPYNYELFSKVTKKSRGRITFDNAGRVRYFPIPFFKKVDSFKYEIMLNDYIKDEGTVYIDYSDLLSNQALKHTITDSVSFAMSLEIKEKFDTVSFEGIRYKVQIGAYKKKLSKKSPVLRNVPKVKIEKSDDGLYKYLVGNHQTMDEGIKTLIRMRRNGLKDSFMAIYKDGERISLKMLYDIAFKKE